ncbi:MAG: tRNA (N(6)-L-threonylcarbamoyladenosine(37)-C(2))-methylthiotransferase MtaB [Thermodesulfovibrionales bacterium]|nr:tRNA (N(6)-L-threonylcarbamoyladenosine(37)-C(2))-methylthiotransferase MtaB [Thermodesulfovibrionales bacterium]
MKISVLTLGCKVNQSESSLIEGALKSSGHQIVDVAEKPDICVVNTCTVTAKSDYQSRQLIRRASRAGARVFVTGCYSELNKESVQSMKGVEAIVNNTNKLSVISKLSNKTIDASSCFPTASKSRFFLKIQDGCNYSCSYCAIPKARGASKSIIPDAVVRQAVKAVSAGFNEIVLTGIHLGTYGIDLKPKVKLSELLETILKQTTIMRIRLSSIEVREIDDELLDLLTDKRICNHLHIPLQSGDDRILKLMNRTYNSDQFSFKIKQIFKKIPGISIGTDVIVGFPGERDVEFQNTYALLERLPISYMHVFPFSSRPATAASQMPDNPPSGTKKERAQRLASLNSRKKTLYMEEQVGKTLEVLIEENNKDGTCAGITGNNLKVIAPINNHSRGSLISVRIQGIQKGKLIGFPIFPNN